MFDDIVDLLKTEQLDDNDKKEDCEMQFDHADVKKQGLERDASKLEAASEQSEETITALASEINALRHAMFYSAAAVFAFEHLHERRIFYRDLKPENLLLTDLGRIKVTDMGLAKLVVGKTYSICGTPDYFAPELIASETGW